MNLLYKTIDALSDATARTLGGAGQSEDALSGATARTLGGAGQNADALSDATARTLGGAGHSEDATAGQNADALSGATARTLGGSGQNEVNWPTVPNNIPTVYPSVPTQNPNVKPKNQPTPTPPPKPPTPPPPPTPTPRPPTQPPEKNADTLLQSKASTLGGAGHSEDSTAVQNANALLGAAASTLGGGYSLISGTSAGSEQSPQIDNSYYRSVIIILFVITIIYLSLVTVSILIKKDARELKCNPLGFLLVNIIPGVEKDDIYKQCISTYEEDTRNKLQTDYNAKVFDISSSIILPDNSSVNLFT